LSLGLGEGPGRNHAIGARYCQLNNAFNGAHLLLYRHGLDSRYDPAQRTRLLSRPSFQRQNIKEWSKKEYEAKIIEIKERLAPLQDARG
jgi:hypothetical protein